MTERAVATGESLVERAAGLAGKMAVQEALAVLAGARTDQVVVTTMGSIREWSRVSRHPLDFHYIPSAMGQGSSLGLGIALARPERRVIVLNGDGSMLMNLGSLVTIAAQGPRNYYLIVIDTVQAYGGNANQMQGDGLMSFFGAPVFHPDHAQRAVNSGLEILRKLTAFNSEQAKKGGLQIEIGVGIATGQVVAGYAGTQSRATYICVGDPVNLSARLESHTKAIKRPIVIDENTCNELDGSIQLEPLGEQIFKGKTIPVKVYTIATI